MPKYAYECSYCEIEIDIVHSMDEDKSGSVCPECGSLDALEKLLVPFSATYKEVQHDKEKVGSLTRKSIEQSREDLKKQRSEIAGKIYDDRS